MLAFLTLATSELDFLPVTSLSYLSAPKSRALHPHPHLCGLHLRSPLRNAGVDPRRPCESPVKVASMLECGRRDRPQPPGVCTRVPSTCECGNGLGKGAGRSDAVKLRAGQFPVQAWRGQPGLKAPTQFLGADASCWPRGGRREEGALKRGS